MKKDLFSEEKIKKYLQGKLAGLELENFQEALKKDKDFRLHVNYAQSLQVANQHKVTEENIASLNDFLGNATEREAAKNKLQVLLKQQHKPTTKVRSLPLQRIMAIAASFLILLALTLFLFNKDKRPQEFAYQPTFIEQEFSPSSGGGLYDSYQLAFRLFNQQQYAYLADSVTFIIERYPNDLEYTPQIRLLLGISHVKLQQYSEAIKNLEAIPDGLQEYPIARYYLAIAFYEAKQIAKAKEVFSEIKNSASVSFLNEYRIHQWIDFLK